VNWTWELRQGRGGAWTIDFATTPLKRWIEQEAARRRRELEDHKVRLEAAQARLAGVSTHLTAVSENFVIGKPMLFKLTLTNGATAAVYYDDQQAAVNESMTITDTDGQLQPYVAPLYQTSGGPETLAPGASAVIFEGLDISRQYEIVKPGRYSVRFSGKGLSVSPETGGKEKHHPLGVGLLFPSDTVEIDVKAR
jgi:hypothetical protein